MRQAILTGALLVLAVANVFADTCPDPQYSCPSETTCCKLEDGDWGCCPMPKALCCEDHIHCCPDGSTCDVEGSRCIQKSGFTPLSKKTRAHKKNEFSEVICPDRKSKCPTDTTCCKMVQGGYGCCPSPQANCCADGLHCCPHGMQCDSTGQRCVNSEGWYAIPWMRKFPSTIIRQKPALEFDLSEEEKEKEENAIFDSEDDDDDANVKVDIIPASLKPIACGRRTSCPAQSTCCISESYTGEVSHKCCPLQNAVCCGDSCCPSGFHCLKGGKCEKKAKHHTQWIFQ